MDLNNVPKQGKFGDSIDAINSNFELLRQSLLENRDGKSAYEIWQDQLGNKGKSVDEFLAWMRTSGYANAYAANESAITEEETIYAVPSGTDANVWYEKILVGTSIITLATHSGSLSGLADTFVEVTDDDGDADLSFSDEQGHVLVMFKDGHVKTSNFDSKSIDMTTQVEVADDEANDYSVSDEHGNIILAVVGGHVKTANFDSSKASAENYVYCVGDSITQGQSGIDNPVDDNVSSAESNCYPNIIQEMLGNDYTVFNLGVGGQAGGEVFARCGLLDIVTTADFTLHRSDAVLLCSGAQGVTEGVVVDSCSLEPANYLMQQGKADATAQMAKCYLNGIPCTLSFTSPNLYIQRVTAVSYDLTIPAGSHITFSGNKGNGIYLLRVGTNDILRYGNSFDIEKYIAKVKQSVERLQGGKYLVMGLFHGWDANNVSEAAYHTAESTINERLSKEFGARYIDGLSYISSRQSFFDLGVTPTTDSDISTTRATAGVKSDTYCITNRATPSSYWRYSCTTTNSSVDKIHLNHDGYYLVAKMFYDKMKEMNWI